MNLAELKKSIVDKNLDNVYIFTGDEIKIMNIYTHQIAKVQNRTLTRKDTVAEIFKTLKIAKLTKESNVYVILRLCIFKGRKVLGTVNDCNKRPYNYFNL